MSVSPMRVAYLLESCWHRVPGGTAVAAAGLAEALARREDVDLVGIAATHRRPPTVSPPEGVPVVGFALPRPLLYESWARLGRPRVDRRCGRPDVVHAAGGAVPACRAPLVATIHDLAWRHRPDHFTPRGRRMFESWLASAAGARRILCPSEATAADLRAAGVDDERIRVVPLGVDGTPANPDAVDALRARHRLDGPVVLWVGVAEPRKNLGGLVEAMTAVPEATLALVGAPGWGVDLPALVEPLGGRALVVGAVDDEEKRGWYSLADVVAFPSLGEGFGLPVLEAMAQGTPVVTSSGTATAEVAGDAGLLVEPTDTAALAEAIRHLLDDPAAARRLADAGAERAARYTWEATAELTVAAYREVLAA